MDFQSGCVGGDSAQWQGPGPMSSQEPFQTCIQQPHEGHQESPPGTQTQLRSHRPRAAPAKFMDLSCLCCL